MTPRAYYNLQLPGPRVRCNVKCRKITPARTSSLATKTMSCAETMDINVWQKGREKGAIEAQQVEACFFVG